MPERDESGDDIAGWRCPVCGTEYTQDVGECGQLQPFDCDGFVEPIPPDGSRDAIPTVVEATVTHCTPGPGLRSDEALIRATSNDRGLPIEFIGPILHRGTRLRMTIEEVTDV